MPADVTYSMTLIHRTYWDGQAVNVDKIEIIDPADGVYLLETTRDTERTLRLAEEHCRRMVDGLRDSVDAERVAEVANAIETLQTAMQCDITARLHDLAYGPALGNRRQPAVILTGQYPGMNTYPDEGEPRESVQNDRGDGQNAPQ